MIIGIGTDIVRIARIKGLIAEYGDKFLARCFTAEERGHAEARHDQANAYARMYAAKEALLKALGTGMREGLSWQDWQISRDAKGAPFVVIGPGVKTVLGHENVNIRLSMSDDGDYAVAFAVIEKTYDRD